MEKRDGSINWREELRSSLLRAFPPYSDEMAEWVLVRGDYPADLPEIVVVDGDSCRLDE
jgi:hypothetical protein